MSELGLLLLGVGAALAVMEAPVPTHGALGGTAVAATAGGLALLVAGAGSGPAVAVAVALAAALVGGGYLWVVLHKALAARRARGRSGAEGLIGRVGEGRSAPAPLGQVFLDGALWRGRPRAGPGRGVLPRRAAWGRPPLELRGGCGDRARARGPDRGGAGRRLDPDRSPCRGLGDVLMTALLTALAVLVVLLAALGASS